MSERYLAAPLISVSWPRYPTFGTAPPAAAWELLVSRLRLVATESKANYESPVQPPGLHAMRMLADALHEYIIASPAIQTEPELADPLYRLIVALTEVYAGRSPLIFQPRRSGGGRPSKSLSEQEFIGTAALAADYFIKSGQSREEAARLVLRAIQTAEPGLPETPNLTTATVLGWRDRLKEGPGRVPLGALASFNYELPSSVGDDPIKRAEWLLEQIKHAPLMRF
jgi:hypothetical protein